MVKMKMVTPLGDMDIACSTRLQPNSTRKEYVAYATGQASYISSLALRLQLIGFIQLWYRRL